jgi:hypothetical protein
MKINFNKRRTQFPGKIHRCQGVFRRQKRFSAFFGKPFDVQPAVRAAMAGARLRVPGFLTGVTIEVEVTDSLSSVSAP